MPRTRHRAAAAAVLALVATAAADVDVEIGNGNALQGTLDPVTETETLRFTVPNGASLKFRAAGAKKGPAVVAALFDGSDAPRGTPKVKGKTTTVSVRADSSGVWSAAVHAAPDQTKGDYAASVSWKSPRKFQGTLTFGAGSSRSFAFAADAGAKVKVVATSRSAARPRISRLAGPSGDLDGVDDGKGGKSDRTRPLRLVATGDHVAHVEDDGGGGDVKIVVTVAPPRASKRKVDIRSLRIDSGGDGGSQAFARVIGADGGAVVVPDLGIGGADDISGSRIDVPAGTLPAGVALVVGTATALDVPSLDETSLGPTVFFGPEGTSFGSKKVSITIPVDLSLVGGDTTKVRVYVRNAKGAVSEVTLTPPEVFDFATTPGYVTFPVSHFSAYRCATTEPGPAPAPNPLTLATIPTAFDLCSAGITPQIAGAKFLTADGPAGTVTALVQGASPEVLSAVPFAGGGGLTTDGAARLDFNFQGDVTCVFATQDGTVYVGTPGRIFRIDGNGAVTRIAGTGAFGDSGDDNPALNAQFKACVDLLVTESPFHDVFVVDRASARVRQITESDGRIRTFIGNGVATLDPDALPGYATSLLDPRAIAFRQGAGGLWVCDAGRLRAIDPSVANPVNFTAAGDPNGATGSAGDGVGGTAARFRSLSSVAVRPDGLVFVSDAQGHTISSYDTAQSLVRLEVGVFDTPASSSDGAAAPFPVQFPNGVHVLGGPVGPTTILFLDANVRLRRFVR